MGGPDEVGLPPSLREELEEGSVEEERKAASPTMGCSVLESQDSSSALGPPVKRLVGVLGVASIHLLPPPSTNEQPQAVAASS